MSSTEIRNTTNRINKPTSIRQATKEDIPKIEDVLLDAVHWMKTNK